MYKQPMTDNQFKLLLSLLERIARAFEAQAHPPVVFTGHELVSNLTPTELKDGTATFPGTDKIAAAINANAIPYDRVRAAILAYQDAKGEHATKAVLKQFGAKYIMDLKADPAQYGAVLEALLA